MTVAQALQRAVQLHQQDRLTDAEALYRDVLRVSPGHPDAAHLLGVLLGQRDQPTPGIELIRRAIAAQPQEAMFHNNLGKLLWETGQLPAAAESFARALALRPDYFEAVNNLGNVQLDLGDAAAAAASYRRARSLNPSDVRLTVNLAGALLATGQADEALAEYRAAIQQDPSQPMAFSHYGAALLQVGQTSASLVALRRAVELEPRSPAHRVHLAAALRQAGEFDAAEAACRAALALDPDSADAHNALANVLGDLGRTDESVAASRRAVALKPTSAESHANLGVGFGELHQFDDAVAAFEEALRLAPDFADGHRNLGMALLALGQFERGWREYEWRWKSPTFRLHACKLLPCPAPRWTGEPLNGRSILLQAEQGFGDTIQFARYVPFVAERGGRVTLAAPRSLHRLLATVSGVTRVVSELSDEESAAFDVQCPLMSLPLTLGMCEPIPNARYLSAPALAPVASYSEEKGRAERAQLAGESKTPLVQTLCPITCAGEGTNRRIGLVWAGNSKLRTDRLRSIPLDAFEPVFCLPGFDFVSLQLGPAAAQCRPPLMDLTEHLHDFADTAALIEQLDLVIAVDTAVAHLAGALGRPTWVLIPHTADWRWQLHRTDSPWYPSIRLFRQPAAGEWNSVIRDVTDALQTEVFRRERESVGPGTTVTASNYQDERTKVRG